jgi:cobalt-zinc-cadmium efflux system outer membrane protein
MGCCLAHASDPWPPPRPIAEGTAAYRAPQEPPPLEEDAGVISVEEPEGPLVLDDALALALMGNPELAVFSWEVRAREASALQAGKIPNPELDVRLWRLAPRQIGDPEEGRRRVILSQDFELGGKRHRREVLAEVERDVAGWDYEAKRIEVATLVSDRFVAVLGGQHHVQTWSRFVEFLEQLHERVSAFVERGVMRSLELHQVTRQVGLARIQLRQAEHELSAARRLLAATWNGASPRFTEAIGNLDPVGPLPAIETLVEIAQRSPTITRWEAELARGQASLSLAKANAVPDLRVGAGVRWQTDRSGSDYLLDFEIDLPIFDRKQGEARRARYEMARAQAARQAAEAAVGAEIAEFYYLLAESRDRGATMREQVIPAARAALEALRQGFEVDPQELGNLLDARRDLARAEVEHTTALVDSHQALVMLEGIVGQSLADVD